MCACLAALHFQFLLPKWSEACLVQFRVTVKLKTITSVMIAISNLLIIQTKLFNRIIPNLNLFRTHKSTIIRSTSKITFSLYPSPTSN